MQAQLPMWAQFFNALGPTILSVALVVVTWKYTAHAARMVKEMQKTREADALPKLVPTYEYDNRFDGVGTVSIVNVGPGAAIDATVMLGFEDNPSVWLWRGLLESGKRHTFFSSRPPARGSLPHRFVLEFKVGKRLLLSGTCDDRLGRKWPITEEVVIGAPWSLRHRQDG